MDGRCNQKNGSSTCSVAAGHPGTHKEFKDGKIVAEWREGDPAPAKAKPKAKAPAKK